MSRPEDIAAELARLGGNGVARFHFDPLHAVPAAATDEAINAWAASRLASTEGRAAISAMMIADRLAFDRAAGPTDSDAMLALARIAVRSMEPACAELAVPVCGHASIDELVRVFVFHLVRIVAAERVEAKGYAPGMGSDFVDLVLGDGVPALKDTAATIRGMILRTLRAEAATNLACDAALRGGQERTLGALAAAIDEMPRDEPVRDTLIRLLAAMGRNSGSDA